MEEREFVHVDIREEEQHAARVDGEGIRARRVAAPCLDAPEDQACSSSAISSTR